MVHRVVTVTPGELEAIIASEISDAVAEFGAGQMPAVLARAQAVVAHVMPGRRRMVPATDDDLLPWQG